MNDFDDCLNLNAPDWWVQRPMTDAEIEAYAEDYARGEAATAQWEAAEQTLMKEYAK